MQNISEDNFKTSFVMFYGFYWYQLCTEMIQPDLPNVLHNLNFENNPGEKVDFGSYDQNLN